MINLVTGGDQTELEGDVFFWTTPSATSNRPEFIRIWREVIARSHRRNV
jgi:alkanesulfonate monooxygenase